MTAKNETHFRVSYVETQPLVEVVMSIEAARQVFAFLSYEAPNSSMPKTLLANVNILKEHLSLALQHQKNELPT